jgi:predicted Zn-dependent protease
MLQFIGRGATPGDAGEKKVLAAMRSLTQLSDPRRGMVQPVRIKVVTAGSGGEFKGLWPTLGSGLVAVQEGAILNGVGVDEPVQKGQWLKLVEAPRW